MGFREAEEVTYLPSEFHGQLLCVVADGLIEDFCFLIP